MKKQQWMRVRGETEWHAVSGVAFGRVYYARCGKQWPESAESECGEHDRRLRCDTCQTRVIEAARINVGLEELKRGVLWEAEMFDV